MGNIVLNPSDWELYYPPSSSGIHNRAIYLRSLDEVAPSAFEYVSIRPQNTGFYGCSHGVVFTDDLLGDLSDAALASVDAIARQYGYGNFDAFVMEPATSDELSCDADGRIDRINSPGYIVDLWQLAAMVVDAHGAVDELRDLTTADMTAYVKRLTGMDAAIAELE